MYWPIEEIKLESFSHMEKEAAVGCYSLNGDSWSIGILWYISIFGLWSFDKIKPNQRYNNQNYHISRFITLLKSDCSLINDYLSVLFVSSLLWSQNMIIKTRLTFYYETAGGKTTNKNYKDCWKLFVIFYKYCTCDCAR